MADATTEELTRLRHELQMVSRLVEWLYVAHFRRGPGGAERFARLSAAMRAEIAALAIPDADPALADHAAQGWLEALEPILARIADRLGTIEDRAT